jgi:hypothetical protein
VRQSLACASGWCRRRRGDAADVEDAGALQAFEALGQDSASLLLRNVLIGHCVGKFK